MTPGRNEPESADASIEELLREVGARDEPSPEAMRDVQAAVHAEWQAVVGERRRQRRAVNWRIAAGMVIAVGASTFALRHLSPEPAQVASIVNIEGSLAVAEENAATQTRAVGAPIMVGETVQTDR